MLIVKKLDKDAVLPACAHPGEDLGFDLFSLGKFTVQPHQGVTIPTGISAQFIAFRPVQGKLVGSMAYERIPYGMLIRDRSSMAKKGLIVSGGVIDAGYTGEISVMLTNMTEQEYTVAPGSKIAQMIPIPVLTGAPVKEVEKLHESARAADGFGSTGQ